MNRRQKLVQQRYLDNEEAVIRELKKSYRQAQRDIELKTRGLQSRINDLQAKIDAADDEERKRVLKSMQQAKIYQKNYQDALKKQVDGILDNMHVEEFKTVSDYLDKCYEEGFLGTMYDLHGQDIPLIFPLDQEAMVRAVQLDTKISEGLYSRLGEDVKQLKKDIAAEISRGISTGASFEQIAQQIGFKMMGKYDAPGGALAKAMTIARTEGHRIQNQSSMDTCYKAREKGADVVKQWDATLDSNTRSSHQQVDGEVRELDEPFSNGLQYPGDPGAGAGEVVNCRCALLQRARWAMDEAELEALKKRAEYFGIDKADSFDDFEKKYMKAAEVQEKQAFTPAKTKPEAEEFARSKGVKYVDYSKLPLETANNLNRALNTLPDDVRPVFMGDSNTLEQYWGGKFKRRSKDYYGVSVDVFDFIHLGPGKYDFDTKKGQMVGISSSYKTADKIKASKEAAQAKYAAKYPGHTWFFNVDGETTPFHEMGHVYASARGLPKGFDYAAEKWSKETKCDMISKPSEAWAEAWASYHTGKNEIPDYIREYIEKAIVK